MNVYIVISKTTKNIVAVYSNWNKAYAWITFMQAGAINAVEINQLQYEIVEQSVL